MNYKGVYEVEERSISKEGITVELLGSIVSKFEDRLQEQPGNRSGIEHLCRRDSYIKRLSESLNKELEREAEEHLMVKSNLVKRYEEVIGELVELEEERQLFERQAKLINEQLKMITTYSHVQPDHELFKHSYTLDEEYSALGKEALKLHGRV
jgi:hypothetical protein